MVSGITRGFQLVADWMRLLLAVGGNGAALADLMGVGSQWLAETVDEAGRVRVGLAAVVFGDPWRGSRAALRAVEARWSGLSPQISQITDHLPPSAP